LPDSHNVHKLAKEKDEKEETGRKLKPAVECFETDLDFLYIPGLKELNARVKVQDS